MLEELLHPPSQTLPGVFHHPVFKVYDMLQVLLCVHRVKETSSLSLSNVSVMQHAMGFFIPSGHHAKWFLTIQCFRVTACFQSFFFSLGQTYQVACPGPRLSSVKWIMCFLSALNQAQQFVTIQCFMLVTRFRYFPMHPGSYTPCCLSPVSGF